MPYCPKCGNEVSQEMDFCPKCGVSLKGERPRDLEEWGKEFGRKMEKQGKELGERISELSRKAERNERHEKEEIEEKTEKHEKRDFGFLGPLIGGLILIFFGLMFYLQVTSNLGAEIVWATLLVIIGVTIIAAAFYAATLARRRHPAT